jgi:hypothetical protein
METDDPLPQSNEEPSIGEKFIDGTINVFYWVSGAVFIVIALLYLFGI